MIFHLWVKPTAGADAPVLAEIHGRFLGPNGLLAAKTALRGTLVPKDNRMVRVGDMLVTARVVSSADITEAIQVSKRLNVPIGRVLITSGCVTEKLLHSALDLQSLMREGEIPLDAALKALSRIDKNGCSVKEALEHLNHRPKYGKGANNLADLLVDSNLVSQEQIDEALKTSFEYGTPLGSTLVFQGALSPSFFPSISAIQEKVSNGELSNEEAIEKLKEAFGLWLKAGDRSKQQALRTIDELSEVPATHRKRNIKEAKEAAVAELPNSSKTNKQEAAEIYPAESEPVQAEKQAQKEEIESKQKSPEESEKSRVEPSDVPAPVERHDIRPRSHSAQVAEKGSAKDKRSLPPNKHTRQGGRLIDLLSAAELLDQENLPAAYQLMLQDTHRSATFLVESGLINDELRRHAERCHSLVRRGRLSPEQAIRALKSSQENELTFREALSKEGITQPAKLEKDWQTGVAAGVVGGFLAAFFSLVVTVFRLVKKR